MLKGLVILEPMERIERSSVAYRATALPLSYIGWRQRDIRNPDLRVTSAVLFERLRRIELSSADYQSAALPLSYGSELVPRDRIEQSSLGCKPSALPLS